MKIKMHQPFCLLFASSFSSTNVNNLNLRNNQIHLNFVKLKSDMSIILIEMMANCDLRHDIKFNFSHFLMLVMLNSDMSIKNSKLLLFLIYVMVFLHLVGDWEVVGSG